MNDVHVHIHVTPGECAEPGMAQLLALMGRVKMDLKEAKDAIAEIAADVETIKTNDAAILTAVTGLQNAQQVKLAEMQAMIDALQAQVADQPALFDAIGAVKAKAEEVKQDSDSTLAAIGASPVPPVVVP